VLTPGLSRRRAAKGRDLPPAARGSCRRRGTPDDPGCGPARHRQCAAASDVQRPDTWADNEWQVTAAVAVQSPNPTGCSQSQAVVRIGRTNTRSWPGAPSTNGSQPALSIRKAGSGRRDRRIGCQSTRHSWEPQPWLHPTDRLGPLCLHPHSAHAGSTEPGQHALRGRRGSCHRDAGRRSESRCSRLPAGACTIARLRHREAHLKVVCA